MPMSHAAPTRTARVRDEIATGDARCTRHEVRVVHSSDAPAAAPIASMSSRDRR